MIIPPSTKELHPQCVLLFHSRLPDRLQPDGRRAGGERDGPAAPSRLRRIQVSHVERRTVQSFGERLGYVLKHPTVLWLHL